MKKPNVEFRQSGDSRPMTEAAIRGIICNPIYTGIGPFPETIPDVEWVAAAEKQIAADGTEQFLVNLLAMLRGSFADQEPPTGHN
jgi:hypothetical protein